MQQSGFNSETNIPKSVKKKKFFLTTVQFAKFIDLISEGEIEGFKSANDTGFKKGTYNYNLACLKDIFFDNTPVIKPTANLTVLDSDGLIDLQESDFNFKGIGFDFREGNTDVDVTKTGTYVQSGTTVTITITDHGFDVGDTVVVDFTSGSAVDGTFIVKSSNLKNEFTITANNSTTISGTNTVSVTRKGQTTIPMQIGTETPVNNALFGTVITKLNPVTIQVPHDSNNPIDAVRVTIGAAPFLKNNSGKCTVKYKIIIVQNDGTESSVEDKEYIKSPNKQKKNFDELFIVGKTTKQFTRDHLIEIPSSYSFPVSIKIVRETKDKGVNIKDKIKFLAMSTIKNEVQKYPNFAHTFFKFDSSQFQSLPKRIYKVRGIKVKIPGEGSSSTGFPSVDNESGRIIYPSGYIFNGQLSTTKVWTSDPAWILYELLTNTVMGLGDYISESQLDVYSFFKVSDYCSALVENLIIGGEKEPRFSLNTTLNTREDAFKVIRDICSVFRGIPFYAGGTVKINQDRPQETPDYVFNLSNVTPEGFTYVGTDLRERATRVTVTYFNTETLKNDVETVDLQDLFGSSSDTTAKESLGEIHERTAAFGCTSRGQAIRAARMLLFDEQRTTQTVNFTTTLEAGVIVRVGSLIEIQDPLKAGLRRGGRIVSATTNTVVVDNTDSTDLPQVNNATISVVMPDGTVSTKNIDSSSGVTGSTITLASGEHFTVKDANDNDVNTAPNPNSVFTIENTTLQNQAFRVISVTENPNNSFSITAITYNSSKYDFVEGIINEIPLQKTTILNDPLPAPKGLEVQETFYVENGQLKNKIDIQWQEVLGASGYIVRYSPPSTGEIEVMTQATSFQIFDAEQSIEEDDQYDIEVFTMKGDGEKSGAGSEISIAVKGKLTPPDDLTGLTVEPIDKNFVKLSWNKSEDVTVLNGGSIYIKHTNLTTGGSFQNSSPIIEAVAGMSTEAIVPKLAGTYVIRAKDGNGTFSTNEQTVQFTVEDSEAEDEETINNVDEDTTNFPGTKTGVETGTGGTDIRLILAGDGIFDEITDFDTLTPNLDQIGDNIATTGTYEFNTKGDLSANNKMPTHFVKNIAATSFLKNTEIDTRNQIDLFSDIDGTKVDEPRVDLFIATTDDDPASGSATFSDFEKFSNATYKGRGFKFKAVLTSTKPDENIRVTTLRATGSLAPRTETQRDSTITEITSGNTVTPDSEGYIASGSTGVNVVFSKRFKTPPTVNIFPRASSRANTVYYQPVSVSETGFTIRFIDSSDAVTSVLFTFTATGFGKGDT